MLDPGVCVASSGAGLPVPDERDLAGRIATLEDISAFLFDLAIQIPEHVEMLFRLSEKAKAEAERLRAQPAA